MIEPLDRGSLSFYLDFINGGEGRKQIAELIGFDASNFVVEQEDGRYGRDVSYSSGEIELEFRNKTFQNGLTHEFKLIQEYFRKYGFESQIKFIIQESGIDYIIGELDFETATGDQIEFFKCTVIQESEQADLKRRIDTKIDLLSSEDLDGNAIDPVSTEIILIQAKPINLKNEYTLTREASLLRSNAAFYVGLSNFYTTIVKPEITTINIPRFFNPVNVTQINRDYLIEANRSIKNLSIVVKDVKVKYSIRSTRDIANFPVNFGVIIGESFADNLTLEYDDKKVRLDQDFIYTGTEIISSFSYDTYEGVINLTIDLEEEILAGQKLWFFFELENTTGSGDFGDTDSLTFLESEGSVTVLGTETDLNSVTRSIRLIDAMKQVCKSIGNFNVNAPRFDKGGELYDQRIFDGNLLRGFEDKPFYLSFEDILDSIKEFNADYEITSNGEVFFGFYEDFYVNQEIASFKILPDEDYEKSFNPRYAINSFKFKYKTFEEDRDETDTLESVHTNTEWLPPNKRVENEKEIEIPFIRDPFKLESTRIRSIEVKETTSLTADNETFILETIESATPFEFTEVVVLTHSIEDNGNIKLLNDGSFSWLRIGLQTTLNASFFRLNNVNVENYTIVEVKNTLLTIQPSNPLATPAQGLFSTSLTYSVLSTNIKNRTDEGFTSITGLSNTEGYSNLRYTPKRNILNHWGSYLNTVCHYRRGEIIKNTFFKNNKNLTTILDGETTPIVEGDDILIEDLNDRILTPVFYKRSVLTNFETVDKLIRDLRDVRGYVTIKDNRSEDIKIHPSSLEYLWDEKKLLISGEERYQIIDFLTITGGNNVIAINQIGYPEKVVSFIIPIIENGKVLIYDSEMLLLVDNPIDFDKVSINGVIGTTTAETLNLLQNL